MTGGPPARIDRAALERILQRATELQAAEHDVGENISPDELITLGRDVGIPARYLQTVTEIAAENNSTTIFPIPIEMFRPFLAGMTGAAASAGTPAASPARAVGKGGGVNALPVPDALLPQFRMEIDEKVAEERREEKKREEKR